MVRYSFYMLILAGLGYLFGSITFKGPSVVIEDGDEEVRRIKPKRSPASTSDLPAVSSFSPLPETSSYWPQTSGESSPSFSDQPFDDENFSPDEGPGAPSEESEGVTSAAPTYPSRNNRGLSSSSPSSLKKNSDTDSNGLGSPSSMGYVGGGNWYQAPSGEIITGPDDTSSDNGNSSSGGSSGSSSNPTLTCTSNYGTGGYSDIVLVELSCSSSASIKYCVSDNTCCDPRTSGLAYTGIIPIGEREGSYCLSFYGTSSSLTSNIVQHTYTVDKYLPDLNVSHLMTYYQTTELSGSSSIESNDFGKMNFDVGQINLLTHDPGPAGLNTNCEDLVLNYGSLTTPAPLVLEYLDASSLSPATLFNLPLHRGDLAYGDNYVLSFMADHSSTPSLYSCSTTKIRLFDFEYFQMGATHGDVGTDHVREFEGGFSAYGFFEASDVYRGPAGESTENKGGQKLETGLFSIFY